MGTKSFCPKQHFHLILQGRPKSGLYLVPRGWASTVQTGTAALWGQHSLSLRCRGCRRVWSTVALCWWEREGADILSPAQEEVSCRPKVMPYKRPFPPWVSVPELTSLLSASPSLLFLMLVKFLSSPLHLVQTHIFSPPCLSHLLLDLVFTSSASAPGGLQLSCWPCLRAPLGLSWLQAGPAALWWACPLGDGSWERLLTL